MLAGRATLIQASSSTIPSYTMQTMHLPANICDKLDRLNRNFLWGDTPTRKKIHLVNWHTVCKNKDLGGLGLKKAKNQNLALLTKIGWKLCNDDDSLWASTLRDKYLKHHSIQSWPSNRAASHTWRSVLHTRDTLKKGIKWSIGDGESVDLWNDWWCGCDTLAERHPGIHTHGKTKVAGIIENGKWNLTPIDHILDNTSRELILGIVLPLYTQASDHPTWVTANDGNYSASEAYDFINRDSNDTTGWKWFWKLHLPQKFKTFIWLILHKKLPTNVLRAHRGITSSDLCPRCNNSPESLSHLFRECPKAVAIWDMIPLGQVMREGIGNSISDWISTNLRKKKFLSIGTLIPWNILFCAALWQIWKDRNKKSFDNFEPVPAVSSKVLVAYASEIVEAFKSPLATASCSHKPFPWSPPHSGNIKLNTDGCRYESNGKAGFGGIFRNEQGEWILGFYGKMVAGSSLETEVWSIYRGLTIILEKGLANTHIESDCQTAIILFNEGVNVNHPQSNIINDGKYLISRTGSTLSHTYRDANQCADHLAHLGAEQEEELIVTTIPPISIREYMLRDTLNIRQILD
ncbi:hypothetical protein Vadar_012160 [Vaccinium darrowii]|uniref:Uncharacterized protein n=1 Tax=Vaccinium darrowii TaxID=229202 RepID=A0ACB7Z3Z0_9ERIC|nr:hypothetical protein Vadar_012160 [Vaccinium darrowii]